MPLGAVSWREGAAGGDGRAAAAAPEFSLGFCEFSLGFCAGIWEGLLSLKKAGCNALSCLMKLASAGLLSSSSCCTSPVRKQTEIAETLRKGCSSGHIHSSELDHIVAAV